MRKALTARVLALAAVLAVGTAASAKIQARTVEDFDKQGDTGKGETIRIALAAFHDLYANRQKDTATADCIVQLFRSSGPRVPPSYIPLEAALETSATCQWRSAQTSNDSYSTSSSTIAAKPSERPSRDLKRLIAAAGGKAHRDR